LLLGNLSLYFMDIRQMQEKWPQQVNLTEYIQMCNIADQYESWK